jgi:acyl transferase domain-containing protein
MQAITTGKLVVACINSPASTTISGDDDAIDELAGILSKLSVFNRKLKVDTAYHSHHMVAVAEQYLLSMKGIEHGIPRAGTEFFSSVIGAIKTTDFGPGYWTQNLVSPVQFDKMLQAVAKDMLKTSQPSTANVFIEMGPHSALQGPSRQVLSAGFGSSFSYSYLAPLVRKRDAIQTTLETIARLLEVDYKLSMKSVLSLTQSSKQPRVIDNLHPYHWDHSTTYWHESRLSRSHRLRRFPYHDLVGVLDIMGDIQSPRWRHYIGPESMPWLRDHVVDGLILFPGTGYIAMAIEAMNQLVQLRHTPGAVSRFIGMSHFLNPW